METLYDVIAVNRDTQKIRFMGTAKSLRNAEAIENMAVMRRGCDEEFFRVCPTNTYQVGDTYHPR